jgi:hypothetical protein
MMEGRIIRQGSGWLELNSRKERHMGNPKKTAELLVTQGHNSAEQLCKIEFRPLLPLEPPEPALQRSSDTQL